jgi:hypothetical protein
MSRITFSNNGTAKPKVQAKPQAASKSKRPSKTEKERTRRFRPYVTSAVAGSAVSLLCLSISHCREGIALLTGAGGWWANAGCLAMAVTIDVGMCACELAELVFEEHEQAGRRWAIGVVIASVIASMALNQYVFSQHASVDWAGRALGVFIPGLILALFRVAGHLAK